MGGGGGAVSWERVTWGAYGDAFPAASRALTVYLYDATAGSRPESVCAGVSTVAVFVYSRESPAARYTSYFTASVTACQVRELVSPSSCFPARPAGAAGGVLSTVVTGMSALPGPSRPALSTARTS